MTKASLTGRHLPNFLLALTQALRELRESDQHGIVEEGSWQEKMVRTYWCDWISNVTAVSSATHILRSLYFVCLFTGGTMSVSASCTTRLCAGCFVLFSVRDVVNWFFRVWLYILRQEHIWQCWLLVLIWCMYRLPNGKPDPKSKHGGCPVLSGVKVSANEQRATQSITDCTITFVDSCYPQHSYSGFFLVLIVFLFR